jgi:hypothetical protein
MKNVLTLYRQFYAMPEEIPNGGVLSHLLVYTIFYFMLGFAISQFIIFLVG